MKKIVFLGNKEIGYDALKFLFENRQRLDIRILACLTKDSMLFDKELSITTLCKTYSVPLLEDLDALLECEGIDMLISVQYHEILKQKHIEMAGEIAVNLHMAPLPEYRGCNQFTFAILDNAPVFGTTIHRLESGIDSGAILFEDRFAIPPNCFVKDLYLLTYERSIALFKQTLPLLLNGQYVLKPQAELMSERSTSFHLRKEIDEVRQIDMAWPAEKKKRHFRATYFPPFPPPYHMEKGSIIHLGMDWYNQLS